VLIGKGKAELTCENFTFFEFVLNVSGWIKGNYTVKVHVQQVPGETYTENNFYVYWIIIAMIGDLTGADGYPDGKVDLRDIALVASKFGANYPDSKYDINCDLTSRTFGQADGKINIRDIAQVAIQFGKTDP